VLLLLLLLLFLPVLSCIGLFAVWQKLTPIVNKGVCHDVGLPIYIKKYLKAKEEL
jgi:hypothetical protein